MSNQPNPRAPQWCAITTTLTGLSVAIMMLATAAVVTSKSAHADSIAESIADGIPQLQAHMQADRNPAQPHPVPGAATNQRAEKDNLQRGLQRDYQRMAKPQITLDLEPRQPCKGFRVTMAHRSADVEAATNSFYSNGWRPTVAEARLGPELPLSHADGTLQDAKPGDQLTIALERACDSAGFDSVVVLLQHRDGKDGTAWYLEGGTAGSTLNDLASEVRSTLGEHAYGWLQERRGNRRRESVTGWWDRSHRDRHHRRSREHSRGLNQPTPEPVPNSNWEPDWNLHD